MEGNTGGIIYLSVLVLVSLIYIFVKIYFVAYRKGEQYGRGEERENARYRLDSDREAYKNNKECFERECIVRGLAHYNEFKDFTWDVEEPEHLKD